MCESGDQCGAIKRFEFVQDGIVDQPRDNGTDVERLPRIGRRQAIKLRWLAHRVARRRQLNTCALADVEIGDDAAADGKRMVVIGRVVVGDAGTARVDLSAAQVFGAHHLPGRGLHERRSAEKDGSLIAHDDGLVGHRRHIGAARGARAHHCSDLGDAGGGKIGLIIKDAAEMLAIGKHFGLARQVGAAGIDQIDARQPVFECDLLRPQMLFHRDGEIGAALDGGVVGDDDAFAPLDPADAGDQSGAVDGVLIHAVRRERRQLKEWRAGIDDPQHPLARQQLAASDVTLPRPGRAAHRRLGATPLQFLHQRAHLRRVGAEFDALGVNRRVENRHWVPPVARDCREQGD